MHLLQIIYLAFFLICLTFGIQIGPDESTGSFWTWESASMGVETLVDHNNDIKIYASCAHGAWAVSLATARIEFQMASLRAFLQLMQEFQDQKAMNIQQLGNLPYDTSRPTAPNEISDLKIIVLAPKLQGVVLPATGDMSIYYAADPDYLAEIVNMLPSALYGGQECRDGSTISAKILLFDDNPNVHLFHKGITSGWLIHGQEKVYWAQIGPYAMGLQRAA